MVTRQRVFFGAMLVLDGFYGVACNSVTWPMSDKEKTHMAGQQLDALLRTFSAVAYSGQTTRDSPLYRW